MIKSSTVYVSNLPEGAQRDELENVFGAIGPIKKCFILNGKGNWYGYVTYALPEDADKAVSELSGCSLRDNQLVVALSNRRSKQTRRSTVDGDVTTGGVRARKRPLSPAERDEDGGATCGVQTKRSCVDADADWPSAGAMNQSQTKDACVTQETPPTVQDRPKERDRQGLVSKRKPRLIVRNISFKVTNETFTAHFAAIGPVVQTSILRKPDGKLIGCGFVQFKHLEHAQTALKKLNQQPFLGRPVIIDWAVDKASYAASTVAPQDDKNGSVEVVNSDSASDGESGYDEDRNDDQEDAGDAADASGDENDLENATDDEEDGEDNVQDESAASDSEDDGDDAETSRKRPAADTGEGRTLFVKNLSFDTDESALRQLFSSFGALKYALICIDPLTEHPRGTGFVQFQRAEDAQSALEAAAQPENASTFTLDDRLMSVLLAVDKQQLQHRKQHDMGLLERAKDKRNLYLAREGLVRDGSRASEGVSRVDLNKRVGLEKWKVKMLKNINMFVSRTRLCVHNVPLDWDDAKLRRLFQKHSPAEADITESRVMRDRRDTSTNPRGASKEYAFVTFSDHQHALAALRTINNNPLLFTASRRPIVEFSVENRAALEAREKRLAKSRALNPTVATPAPSTATSAHARQNEPARPDHAGMAADPALKSLPKLKERAGFGKITRKMLKKPTDRRRQLQQQRRQKAGQKQDPISDDMAKYSSTSASAGSDKKPTRREKKSAVKAKKAGVKEDASFAALVDTYKRKLTSSTGAGGTARWFE